MNTNDYDNDFRSAIIRRCIHSFMQSLIASAIVLFIYDDFGVYRILLIAFFATLFTFLVGMIFGYPEGSSAGTLYVDTTDASTDRYLMDFDDLDGLKKKKKVQIKIRTDRKLSQDPKYVGED